MAVYTILSSHSLGVGFIREKDRFSSWVSLWRSHFRISSSIRNGENGYTYISEDRYHRYLVLTPLSWKTLRYCILLGWMHTDSQFHGPEFYLARSGTIEIK